MDTAFKKIIFLHGNGYLKISYKTFLNAKKDTGRKVAFGGASWMSRKAQKSDI